MRDTRRLLGCYSLLPATAVEIHRITRSFGVHPSIAFRRIRPHCVTASPVTMSTSYQEPLLSPSASGGVALPLTPTSASRSIAALNRISSAPADIVVDTSEPSDTADTPRSTASDESDSDESEAAAKSARRRVQLLNGCCLLVPTLLLSVAALTLGQLALRHDLFNYVTADGYTLTLGCRHYSNVSSSGQVQFDRRNANIQHLNLPPTTQPTLSFMGLFLGIATPVMVLSNVLALLFVAMVMMGSEGRRVRRVRMVYVVGVVVWVVGWWGGLAALLVVSREFYRQTVVEAGAVGWQTLTGDWQLVAMSVVQLFATLLPPVVTSCYVLLSRTALLSPQESASLNSAKK